MKQVLQNLGTGETTLVDVPAPRASSGTIIVGSTVSLISAGTERMLVDFGKASMLEKARQQPEKVKMVLDKIRTDGLFTTLDAVKSKLDQPLPLGYCNVGRVLEVGNGVDGFKMGDRVVSNGSHAEVVRVTKNLAALIPDNVSDEEAAFVVLASIGLQGIRLAQPTLGEAFVVTGVGLIGLLTVQLLRAQGCRVLAVDFDAQKLALAAKFGASVCNPGTGEDLVQAGMSFSRGRGVDGVIITASTKSSDPISQAAQMSRKRGRIILVGVTGLELNRAEFYEKELTFQVSCSYGPGRYDADYEVKGNDYPIGYVRWTEQRNFEAVLDMMVSGQLDVKPLIFHRFDFEDALQAYSLLTNDRSALGILLNYREQASSALLQRSVWLKQAVEQYVPTEPVFGFIGAGNYASRMLIPAFKDGGAKFDTIVTSGGVSGVHHGAKAGFARASTDEEAVFANKAVNAVAIVTQHDSHARFTVKALEAGKDVFVEKPLALTFDELERIESARQAATDRGRTPRIMVGFNRRFSPLVKKMKELLSSAAAPKSFIYTCNAGMIPANHWTQDMNAGGGRIIGEACHFVDLLRFLAGSPIMEWQVMTMGRHTAVAVVNDKAIINLKFEDGSIGTIQYFANGGKRFPKERIEVFAGDAVLQLDNYLVLRGYDWPGFSKMKLWKQDKGQNACARAFIDSIKNGQDAPIPFNELVEVAQTMIEIAACQAGMN